ncbi:hypothetical protein [Clostridium rhizosphaerae]|nr:hypothetical protein [Clostridium rhizosphaerae]
MYQNNNDDMRQLNYGMTYLTDEEVEQLGELISVFSMVEGLKKLRGFLKDCCKKRSFTIIYLSYTSDKNFN